MGIRRFAVSMLLISVAMSDVARADRDSAPQQPIRSRSDIDPAMGDALLDHWHRKQKEAVRKAWERIGGAVNRAVFLEPRSFGVLKRVLSGQQDALISMRASGLPSQVRAGALGAFSAELTAVAKELDFAALEMLLREIPNLDTQLRLETPTGQVLQGLGEFDRFVSECQYRGLRLLAELGSPDAWKVIATKLGSDGRLTDGSLSQRAFDLFVSTEGSTDARIQGLVLARSEIERSTQLPPEEARRMIARANWLTARLVLGEDPTGVDARGFGEMTRADRMAGRARGGDVRSRLSEAEEREYSEALRKERGSALEARRIVRLKVAEEVLRSVRR